MSTNFEFDFCAVLIILKYERGKKEMVKLRLEQRLSLKQILTPQLIQTMKLLQIPRLELENDLKLELDSNPFLEIVEEKEQDSNQKVEQELDEWDNFIDQMNISFPHILEKEPESDFEPINIVPAKEKLFDHLMKQLRLSTNNKRELAIGEAIIGNLNRRGFISLPLETIIEYINEGVKLTPPTDMDEVERVLSLIQTFDPPGIAARNLRESLLLQLENIGKKDSLAYRIINEEFENLLSDSTYQIPEKMGVSPEDFAKALSSLRTLSFAPASEFDVTNYSIEPDLIVEKINGKWEVRYNNSSIPTLRVNHQYMKMLKNRKKLSKEEKKDLLDKLNSARWWVNSLQHRESILIATMNEIIAHQLEFFERGPGNLHPLKMEEIANEVGIHTATVSRVVSDKYVQTPHGIYPMKYFFIQGLKNLSGETTSAEKVQKRITEIVKQENPSHPLSDQAISDMLRKEGIICARRTVVKYRQKLNIPPARFRKRQRS
ncbi:MAG: RNA polymerase sigma-54 factor [candidate division Zixibacteria bacterium 4484_93]|nr:MAG: RNA polymerase sigma-54 factor [candidate division Zixibacteria bacterium 4484_93]